MTDQPVLLRTLDTLWIGSNKSNEAWPPSVSDRYVEIDSGDTSSRLDEKVRPIVVHRARPNLDHGPEKLLTTIGCHGQRCTRRHAHGDGYGWG
jgi:hypothetical protein